MSLYNDASLLLIPSGYKSGKVYCQKPTDGDGDLTFTRASSATRVNSDGEIESVATGVPRLDYSQGSCPSLLLEPQRTNLVLYSEQFDNAVWFKTNSSISANATTAPNGTLTADKLVENSTNANYYTNQAITNTNGLFTYSIYAKASERTFLYINAFATIPNNFSYVPSAYFDLANGTVGTTSSCNASITSVGNGWFRCVIQCTSVFASSSASVNFYNYLATANGTISYQGDGTSGVFIWGAQLEVGAYATSYIPTTTTTVTRIADVASKTGISSLIGQTEGTMFVEVNLSRVDNTSRFFTISDGTNSNRIEIFFLSSTELFATIRVSGVNHNLGVTVPSVPSTGGSYKIGLGYKANDFCFSLNGTNYISTATRPVPTCSVVSVGTSATASSFLGDRVNQALLFKTRLSNTELAQITSL